MYWHNKLWFPRMSPLKSPDSHDGCSGRSAQVSTWLTVSAPFTRVISQNISTRHTQHYELQHFISEYFTRCMYFLRGLLKSLKSCDVTKVFGFSVKLVFRRKRHKAIRIWCVLVPRRRESQNLVRMGSWGGECWVIIFMPHLVKSHSEIDSSPSLKIHSSLKDFQLNAMTWIALVSL